MVGSLPQSLILLFISSLHAYAQISLSLNTILPMTITSNTQSPMMFSLPPSTAGASLSISVALCSDTQPFPSFSVSNGTNSAGEGDAQLSLDEGIGVWTGATSSGASLVVSLGNASSSPGTTWSFELALSSGAPLHRSLSTPPLLGDTTATQALLFSPPFNPPTIDPPSYPNFTLPNGNVSFPNVTPPPASSQPNASLILTPTSQLQQQFNHLTKSACAIQNAAKSISGSWLGTNGTGGVNGSTSLVLRDTDGWRSQWIVEGLTASTNYSVWVVQDGGALAGPIYAFTKSSSFACPLVHSLPYCPLTSYAVPFPPTPDGATTYSASNLPSNVSDLLISSLSNFTIALLTFPCGRDVYSPIQTCESCATAYRTWACQVSLPRCGEIPPTLASSLTSQPTPSKESKESNNMPLPTPAILSHPPAQSRLEPAIDTYDELLPCIETCHAMDRACPPFLGITCPHTTVNANWSYGIGFIDAWAGTQGEGNPGVAQDQWGVTWCNG